MSATITAYVVYLDRLSQAAGSRDARLIQDVAEGRADFFRSVDEIDEDAGMSCEDALVEIIYGSASGDFPGYLFGYALEALCSHIGVALPNIAGISGATEWLQTVDQFLAARNVPLSLSKLVFGGSPVKIPRPDDHPFIGTWLPGDMIPALAAMERLDPSTIDADMRETWTKVRGWLRVAADAPGAAIVGFLS